MAARSAGVESYARRSRDLLSSGTSAYVQGPGGDDLRRWRADGKLEITNMRTGEVLPLYTDVLEDLDRHGATRLNVERAARQIGIPWLVIHGDGDEAVSVDAGRHLAEWMGQGDRELLVVEGGAHTLGARHPWSGTTPQLEGALDASIRWFVRHLL